MEIPELWAWHHEFTYTYIGKLIRKHARVAQRQPPTWCTESGCMAIYQFTTYRFKPPHCFSWPCFFFNIPNRVRWYMSSLLKIASHNTMWKTCILCVVYLSAVPFCYPNRSYQGPQTVVKTHTWQRNRTWQIQKKRLSDDYDFVAEDEGWCVNTIYKYCYWSKSWHKILILFKLFKT